MDLIQEFSIDRPTLVAIIEELHEDFGIGDPNIFADAFLAILGNVCR